jgi:pSer/pThr/pTyr-binding forkhead associated (FHA) protein
MSSNLIKKITGAFNKKDNYEATNVRLPHPYYKMDEPSIEAVNTQPRLKIPQTQLDRTALQRTGEEGCEATKVAQLNTVQDQFKQRWILKVVAGVDQGRQYLAATHEIKIGRKPENHISLKDPKVSRFHALLRFEDTVLSIVDLNSTNGTSVNGKKITTTQKLCSGDQIRVGETLIQIVAEPW